MSKSSLPTSRQYYFIFIAIGLIILSITDGVLLLIPENYRSYYALLAAIILMMDILIIPLVKPLTQEEKKVRPFWILLGTLSICGVLSLIIFRISPENAFPWIITVVFLSGFMSSLVLYQHLQNRKIIPWNRS